MPAATATPTPEEAHFPADPLQVLQFGWPFLVAYYVVALVIVIVLWRALKVSRFAYSVKHRAIIAAILAAIFAPSEVSDFFLFNLPGPAVAGLAMLLLAVAFVALSQPAALLKISALGGFFGTIAGYYLLPLLVMFVIAFTALSVCARSHARVQPNA